MCRLFGFRSVISSQVHQSLANADNALMAQSVKHPNGWGVAFYRGEVPHLIKSPDSAQKCSIFHRVSGVVASQTVLAHIRKATQGQTSILNSHPFQYGRWTFAHNGNIKHFQTFRPRLEQLIRPELARYVLGDTDSEIFFKILLSGLISDGVDIEQDVKIDPVMKSVKKTVVKINQIIGEISDHDIPTPEYNYLTFILTDGKVMVGMQGGQPLNYCTYKTRCPDRDSCSFFAPMCEGPDAAGRVNHLILSSEIIEGPNVWFPLKFGEMIGVDAQMVLSRESVILNGPVQKP